MDNDTVTFMAADWIDGMLSDAQVHQHVSPWAKWIVARIRDAANYYAAKRTTEFWPWYADEECRMATMLEF